MLLNLERIYLIYDLKKKDNDFKNFLIQCDLLITQYWSQLSLRKKNEP